MDPKEHYWGEKVQPIEAWAKPIIARGPRPEFEMEQVLPGADPDDPFSEPIIESNDLEEAGERPGAQAILMEFCPADLRCLDAHAHLGNLVFDSTPEDAVRHFSDSQYFEFYQKTVFDPSAYDTVPKKW